MILQSATRPQETDFFENEDSVHDLNDRQDDGESQLLTLT